MNIAMFTRIFDTAKHLWSRSPSVPGRSSEARESPPATAPSAHATMVTTRGGIETPGAATPRSSAKKRVGKRELDALDTPTQTKRQKKATPPSKRKVVQETPEPDGVQESDQDTSDTIALEQPETPGVLGSNSAKKGLLPIRRRSSPKVVVAKPSPPLSTATESFEEAIEDDTPVPTQETVYHTPNLRSASKKTTPKSRRGDEGSPTPKAQASKDKTPTSAKKTRGRPKKVQEVDEPHSLEVTQTTTTVVNEIPTSTAASEQTPITPRAKKAHKRFGSEEPIPEAVVEIPTVEEEQDDDDDDASDSDDAPEVVTTATAISKALAAQAEADRALRAQQTKETAKRQAREELLAAQQAAKRERDEKKAKKLARIQAQQQSTAATTTTTSEDESTPRPAFEIPTNGLLPESLLATIDAQRPPTPPPSGRGKTEEQLRKEKLNHHVKFLERTEKPAKDVKKGNLSVAVLGRKNGVLPPKGNKNTGNVRENWLKGRTVQKKKGGKTMFQKGKMERRAVGAGVRGFLKGED